VSLEEMLAMESNNLVVPYQFKFVIFTLDKEGYDVSNVEKYLVRVLYRDNAECVDVELLESMQ